MEKNRLQEIMYGENLTYRTLSKLSGDSLADIHGVANNVIDPRQSIMIAISRALKMDVTEVFFLDWMKNNDR